MREKFLLCDDCFEFLGKQSPSLALAWISLCRDWVSSENFIIVPNEPYAALECLEKRGYITTHEQDDKLLIRVEGFYHDDDEDQDFFCVNLDEHFPIENIGEI